MSTVVTKCYSNQAMADPATYFGGYKHPGVLDFGWATLPVSDPKTGELQGASYTFRISDHTREIRQEQASAAQVWTEPLAGRMESRDVRRDLGDPYVFFVGPIMSAQPVGDGLEYEITLGDAITSKLNTDEAPVLFRRIGDGFLNLLRNVSEKLNRKRFEPVLYGKHRRIVDVDEPSPQGFVVSPIYLGVQTLSDEQDWHVWMVCGHACADIPDVLVGRTNDAGEVTFETVLYGTEEGYHWLIPHHAGFGSMFGAPYVDYESSTYPGDVRRYTLIYGLFGATDPDACAKGDAQLAVMVDGMELVGDGSGPVEEDRVKQYKHYCLNYWANSGRSSYQSGPYLTNPEWSILGSTVQIIDEASFDAGSAIGAFRLPAADDADYPAGYIGAAAIGFEEDGTFSLRSCLSQWNLSCDAISGWTNLGQYRIALVHPTEAIKAAAPLFTDVREILTGTFSTDVRWTELVNRQPFHCDYYIGTGAWRTTGDAAWQPSIDTWREKVGDTREFRYAPGITMAYHLARMIVLRQQNPPRVVTFEAPAGPLALKNFGDYIHVLHFAAVGAPGVPRLGMILTKAVAPGECKVRVTLLDVEDLLNYDAPDEEAS